VIDIVKIMLVACHVLLSAFALKPISVPEGSTRFSLRMSSSALPDMYRERWAHDTNEDVAPPKESVAIANEFDAAKYVGALLGSSAMAAIGVSFSTASTDYSLSLLNTAGMFDQSVLFTDKLMDALDTANVAGYAMLPLAVLYMMQATPKVYVEAVQDVLQEEACLIPEEQEPICGAMSFDSTEDGMFCIEDYSSGGLKWVCA